MIFKAEDSEVSVCLQRIKQEMSVLGKDEKTVLGQYEVCCIIRSSI